jgi:hypothetical protein
MGRTIARRHVSSPKEGRRAKSKSPFLLENTTRTAPHTSQSLYIRELFERSDKAVDQLKNNRGRLYRVEE